MQLIIIHGNSRICPIREFLRPHSKYHVACVKVLTSRLQFNVAFNALTVSISTCLTSNLEKKLALFVTCHIGGKIIVCKQALLFERACSQARKIAVGEGYRVESIFFF